MSSRLNYVMDGLFSQIASLLGNLDAHVFGVSLSAPPPNSSPLPISIHPASFLLNIFHLNMDFSTAKLNTHNT